MAILLPSPYLRYFCERNIRSNRCYSYLCRICEVGLGRTELAPSFLTLNWKIIKRSRLNSWHKDPRTISGCPVQYLFSTPKPKIFRVFRHWPQLDHYFQQIGPVLMDFENDGGVAILKVERPPAF